MLEKVDSYVQEIKELNSEIHAKIAGEIEIKKKKSNNYRKDFKKLPRSEDIWKIRLFLTFL